MVLEKAAKKDDTWVALCSVDMMEVRMQIETSNTNYKAAIDKHMKPVLFVVGDYVWAVLTEDHYPTSAYNKLSAKKIGPCEITEKINDNAYQLNQRIIQQGGKKRKLK